jgi:hypothetical protein
MVYYIKVALHAGYLLVVALVNIFSGANSVEGKQEFL